MSGHGKTIRIYLADGSATGIRHAEVVNWTGQAIACPRTRVGELSKWEESQRPGVYLLFGDDPEGTRPMLYVGEAENVAVRLRNHIASKDPKKDFWDRVVLFTSKDQNLTKAHVKHLEARVFEIARELDRVTLANGQTPTQPTLPRADRAAMEEFLGPLRMLLSALGFMALQPLRPVQGANDAVASGPLADVVLNFQVTKRGVNAAGVSLDEGFLVLANSQGDSNVRKTLSKGWRAYREELIAEGAIVDSGSGIVFKRDILFTSPSAAAGVVAGGVWNGREAWRNESGQSLKELEDSLVDGIGNDA